MPCVTFDPRLLAVGAAFAHTPARQLLILAGWAKLNAVHQHSDASLAEAAGLEFGGADGVWVSNVELDWIRTKLPSDVPSDLLLVSSRSLLDEAANSTAGLFADEPSLRAQAEGLNLAPLVANLVLDPQGEREPADVLLHCGLEAGGLLVSDHHPVVVAAQGAPLLVEDNMNGRSVTVMSSSALAGSLGRSVRFVPHDILRDICMLLKARPAGANA